MIRVIESVEELRELRSSQSGSVNFVPTMGNLHEGHLTLLRRALAEADVTYFSIFVNPKQFGPSEDFHRYPRTLEDDLRKIQRVLSEEGGSVYVFTPKNSQEVFPEDQRREVSVLGISSILEGALRPGHFQGVATVVLRLFELVRPKRAYFGLKDYQQYLVIRQMVQDLSLPVDIVGLPIIRDPSGLALSSRNQYLSESARTEGLVLSQTLRKLSEIIKGEKENLPAARKEIKRCLETDPRWNYLELRDAETLGAVDTATSRITVLAVYQLGETRLLDNFQMELE